MAHLKHPSVPMLYKGAGPLTHWHTHNALLSGFTPASALGPTLNELIGHITTSPQQSPYISFSTSFAVAREYALSGPGGLATAANPGYVYVIDLSQLAPSAGLTVIDPIFEIARRSSGFAHEHNGDMQLIAQIAQTNPVLAAFTHPRVRSGGTAPPVIAAALLAMVRAVRDAEVLVAGNVPKAAVVHRDDVY